MLVPRDAGSRARTTITRVRRPRPLQDGTGKLASVTAPAGPGGQCTFAYNVLLMPVSTAFRLASATVPRPAGPGPHRKALLARLGGMVDPGRAVLQHRQSSSSPDPTAVRVVACTVGSARNQKICAMKLEMPNSFTDHPLSRKVCTHYCSHQNSLS